MNIVEFSEKLSPAPLTEWQKQFLEAYEKAHNEGDVILAIPPRINGKVILQQIIQDYERNCVMQFCFGDIVVVEGDKIGVVVKSWVTFHKGERINNHDVYVRMCNEIKNYKESEMQRYMVRHKYLSEEELEYQRNAVLGI